MYSICTWYFCYGDVIGCCLLYTQVSSAYAVLWRVVCWSRYIQQGNGWFSYVQIYNTVHTPWMTVLVCNYLMLSGLTMFSILALFGSIGLSEHRQMLALWRSFQKLRREEYSDCRSTTKRGLSSMESELQRVFKGSAAACQKMGMWLAYTTNMRALTSPTDVPVSDLYVLLVL